MARTSGRQFPHRSRSDRQRPVATNNGRRNQLLLAAAPLAEWPKASTRRDRNACVCAICEHRLLHNEFCHALFLCPADALRTHNRLPPFHPHRPASDQHGLQNSRLENTRSAKGGAPDSRRQPHTSPATRPRGAPPAAPGGAPPPPPRDPRDSNTRGGPRGRFHGHGGFGRPPPPHSYRGHKRHGSGGSWGGNSGAGPAASGAVPKRAAGAGNGVSGAAVPSPAEAATVSAPAPQQQLQQAEAVAAAPPAPYQEQLPDANQSDDSYYYYAPVSQPGVQASSGMEWCASAAAISNGYGHAQAEYGYSCDAYEAAYGSGSRDADEYYWQPPAQPAAPQVLAPSPRSDGQEGVQAPSPPYERMPASYEQHAAHLGVNGALAGANGMHAGVNGLQHRQDAPSMVPQAPTPARELPQQERYSPRGMANGPSGTGAPVLAMQPPPPPPRQQQAVQAAAASTEGASSEVGRVAAQVAVAVEDAQHGPRSDQAAPASNGKADHTAAPPPPPPAREEDHPAKEEQQEEQKQQWQQPQPPPPQLALPQNVHNPFADSLAKAAMARLERAAQQRAARASSLLTRDVAAPPPLPPQVLAPAPAPASAHDGDERPWRDNRGGAGQDAGAGVPLARRSLSPARSGSGSAGSPPTSEWQAAKLQPPRPSAAGSGASFGAGAARAPDSGRPRLNLLPRSKPLEGGDAARAATGASAGGGAVVAQAQVDAPPRKASSVFGEAKPRELVLQSRGIDPTDADSQLVRRGSRSGSPTGGGGADSGPGDDEDSWQVVGAGGRRVQAQRAASGAARGSSLLGVDDPFFGGAGGAGAPAPPPAQTYGGDSGYVVYGPRHHGHARGFGSFGSAGSGGGVLGGNEEGVFRRALPTRHDDFLLV